MTTPSLTNPNPKREDEREAGSNEQTGTPERLIQRLEDATPGLLFYCEADREEALEIAREEMASALASARPSPGGPVRAALEEHRARLFEPGDDQQRYRFGDGGTLTLTITNAQARAALSVSTPTGEGEEPAQPAVSGAVELWGERLTNADRLRIAACYHREKLPTGLDIELLGLADEWDDELEAAKAATLRSHPTLSGGKPGEGELREALDGLLPGPLCGESWGCPDDERVSMPTTFGAIRRARSALASPVAEEPAGPVEGTEVPDGAIYNGYVFLQRLSDQYRFCDEDGGPIALCVDYVEAVRCFEVMADYIAATALAAPKPNGVGDGGEGFEVIQHVKTQGLYEVLTRDAQVQTDTPLADYAFVAVYRNAITGVTWVRPVSEMDDGRFVTLRPTAPTSPSKSSGEEA